MIYEDINEIRMTEAENERRDMFLERFYEDYREYLPVNGVRDIVEYMEELTDTLRGLDIELEIEVYADNMEDGSNERIDVTVHRELDITDTELDRTNGKLYINSYTV